MLTLARALIILAAGAVAGSLGAVLGIGGGVLLVPFLNLVVGFPLRSAAAISLATVIATSSSVTSRQSSAGLMNLRLGMVLEVATVAGSVTGGLTAHLFRESTLQALFGILSIAIAGVTLGRLGQRNVIRDTTAELGPLGGAFYDEDSGADVIYRVKRLPLGLLASFVAGNVSSLLGVGGGIIKVPVLNTWCGVPLRVAAATSALMIGVTATSGAVIYYGRGDLAPLAAAPAVLGVQLGSWAGLHFGARVSANALKLLMAVVLIGVAVVMFIGSIP